MNRRTAQAQGYVGAGWLTTGDARLANTAAAQAREHGALVRGLEGAFAELIVAS